VPKALNNLLPQSAQHPTFGMRGKWDGSRSRSPDLAFETLRQYGAEVRGPARRLKALREVAPGELPDDYAATLLELRRTTWRIDNRIEAIEPPRPAAPGTFERAGPTLRSTCCMVCKKTATMSSTSGGPWNSGCRQD
jgi:hypothetical protein